MGIGIFESVREALKAGYMLESPYPDDEGFLQARIQTKAGWAKALVRMSLEPSSARNLVRRLSDQPCRRHWQLALCGHIGRAQVR